MTTKTFYQLSAIGPRSCADGISIIHSKKIFSDKEKALKYFSEFEKIVTTPKDEYDLYYLESVDDIVILELVLGEE